MFFCGKQLLSTVTVLFLVVLTFTTGDEGSTVQVQQSIGDVSNKTQEGNIRNSTSGRNSSSIDYEWSSNDDYVNDGPINDDEMVSPIPKNETKTEASVSPRILLSLNDTDLVTGQNPENNTTSSESTLPQVESSTTGSNGSNEPPQASPAESNSSSSAAPLSTPTSEVESSITTTTENGNTTSTEKVSPSKIITQDLGDESDYTSTIGPDRSGPEPRLKTWAVVVVSILISFAVVFTILYFIRGELIRRRKADQRRLLRGSVSSEGYFYGDGEGNTSGKFEL